ncbi:hypothetical protein FGU65_03580 [Methanoculleus sp. FWC-SCC1]|uniref:Uncharacterized protein n=1 Tax=Methanoculleus frigidifontis TaxID=2584085 RepID=A0ABT8M7S8_9EURY|nr:hypothetical protein [Methanoculleus sp. FWC-SCC1]MDN7023980.1 hypothetical protein [Methanoculleus sp. FWC-SCC1]
MDTALRHLVRILCIALLLAGLFIGFSAYVQSTYAETLSSTYTYEITLETDRVLTNVTLFLPLPENGGRSPVTLAVGRGDLAGLPRGWGIGLYGAGNATFMKITADRIAPEYRPPPVAVGEEGNPAASPVLVPIRLVAEADAGAVIDTAHPLGNSTLLRPKYSLTGVACDFPHDPASPPVCYTYETAFFASYRAAPDARVTITVGLTGSNTWFVFGWSGNELRDRAVLTLTGPSDGWQRVRGAMKTGIGRYEIV